MKRWSYLAAGGALMACAPPAPRGPFVAADVVEKTTATAFVGATSNQNYAAGTASQSGQEQVSEQTQFAVGSLTKTVTAALIFQAEDEMLLSTEERIATYLPELETHFPDVTIDQCLRHETGIPDYLNVVRTSTEVLDQEDVRVWLAEQSAGFAPGARQDYSNSNYFLLGLVLQQVNDAPWAEIIAGLSNDVGWDSTAPCNVEPTGRAVGYTGVDSTSPEPARALTPTISFAAGNLCSTLADWRRWLEFLEGNSKLESWLREDSSAAYGRGIERFELAGGDYWGHSGKISGFSAFWGSSATSDAYFITFVNSDTVDIRGVAEHMVRAQDEE